MNLRDEFHLYLDREWPNWKQYEGRAMYLMLWKAFQAGAAKGITNVTTVTLPDPGTLNPYWYGLDWNLL